MGHLGQGVEITTIQDNEIVLTASNGQHFRMKIADLAEAVRQVMPVATTEKNGLMGTSDRNRNRIFSLQVGEEVNTGINHAGIISITAGNITGSSSIGISTVNSTFVYVLHEGSGSFAFVDVPGKVCCFKKNETGTFFLKNNTSYNSPVSVAVL